MPRTWRRRGRQLEPEPQLETGLLRHVCEVRADRPLALLGEREVRPDVRRRVEDRRPVRGGLTAETEALDDPLRSVVARRHDMRVDVDEKAHTARVPAG